MEGFRYWIPGHPEYRWCKYGSLVHRSDKCRILVFEGWQRASIRACSQVYVKRYAWVPIDYPCSEMLVRLPDWMIYTQDLESYVVPLMREVHA